MRVTLILADYPDWIFSLGFAVAGILLPTFLFVLIGLAAVFKHNARLARNMLITAAAWFLGSAACVLFLRLVLVQFF